MDEREEAAIEQERIDAERALKDPAIQRAFDKLEAGLVDLIAGVLYNRDSESSKAYQLECCRTLRTLRGLRNSLYLPEQTNRIEKENLRLLDRANIWGNRKRKDD